MDDTKRAIMLMRVIAESIRDAKTMPEGVLYAHLMTIGMTLEGFQRVISTLENAKLIKRSNHVITWIGPEVI